MRSILESISLHETRIVSASEIRVGEAMKKKKETARGGERNNYREGRVRKDEDGGKRKPI